MAKLEETFFLSLNRTQRSTQPRILLFSLETLICNRSPLPPLSPSLPAYVITSSCAPLGNFLAAFSHRFASQQTALGPLD